MNAIDIDLLAQMVSTVNVILSIAVVMTYLNTWAIRNKETGQHWRNGHLMLLEGIHWVCRKCGHQFDAAEDANLFICGEDCVHRHPLIIIGSEGVLKMLITRECPHCGKTGRLDLSSDQCDELTLWLATGQQTFIQEGLSTWTTPMREQWLSGTHPSCWNELMKED